MNERPISVGDLVVVAKPTPCGCTHTLGNVFRVTAISVRHFAYCGNCRHVWDETVGADGLTGYQIALSRLRRIPPLTDLEGQRTEEKLKEPA